MAGSDFPKWWAENVEPPDSEPEIVKLTVNLPAKIWQHVERMAEAQGVTRTEMLRRCVSTEAWRHRAVNEQGATIIEDSPSDGEFRIDFPY